MAAASPLIDIPYMVTAADDPPVYKALMALKPEGLTTNSWATQAGVARNAFQDLKRHGNPKVETLQKLLDVIDISLSRFELAMQPVQTEVIGSGAVGAKDIRGTFFAEPGLPAIPLVGTAMGGTDDAIDGEIEMTELMMAQVIEYLSRPASLAGDADAYAVTIVGDSMAPRFRPSERVAVSPKAPVAIGDDVIVQLRRAEGDGERITMVLIKTLLRRTPSYVELQQYNPDRIFRVEAHRVAAIHKVTTNFF